MTWSTVIVGKRRRLISASQLIVNMGADAIPIAVVTGFFGVVGFVLPFVVGRGPNKG